MNNQKVYFGEEKRFIVQQEIGFQKLLDVLRRKFDVKELRDSDSEVILIEEQQPKI